MDKPRVGTAFYPGQSKPALEPTQSPSYSMANGGPPRWKSTRGVMLTTGVQLAPRLRMSGAIPLLSLNAFVA
jgi:hypothetical protein